MLLRPLLFLSFTGLLLLPDWSTARPFRRWTAAAPAPCPTYFSYPASYPVPAAPPVVYAQPVYAPVPPAPALAACPPVTPAPRGPQVIPERMAEPRSVEPKSPATRATPPADPIPAARAAPPADPIPAPAVIRPVGNEERLPPMPVPVPPRPVAELQPVAPKPPVEYAPPKAVADESHKPATKPDPLPTFPLPGQEKGPKSELPQFDLPPLPPLAPPQPIASEKPTTAKSSPLNAEAVADVYPLAGPAPAAAAKRSVAFVNKSGRDVVLTVEGTLTMLPSGQYLQLKLPATFAWQIGGEKERQVTVPAAAAGVDVVIRR